MKSIRITITLYFLILATTAFAGEQTYFLEDTGKIVIEIESVSPGEDWSSETTITDYYGDAYYVWRGGQKPQPADNDPAIMRYNIKIAEAGNYQFRWLSYIAEGELSTESNDSWVRFLGGEDIEGEEPLTGWTKAYMGTLNQWSWTTVTVNFSNRPIRQYFSAGDHAIEVSGRSNGHAIDRMVLYKYEDIAFSNSLFNSYIESETTIEPSETGGAEGEEETNPSPPLLTEHVMLANQCTDSTVSLPAVEDITLDSGLTKNDNFLSISGVTKKALLKFDLRAIPANINSATFQFFPSESQGTSDILVYGANHSEWSEDTPTNELPDSAVLLGSMSIDFSSQGFLDVELDKSLLSRDYETIVLLLADNADPVKLSSSETTIDPRLVLNGNSLFCDSYDANVSALNSEPEESEETVDPEPAEEVSEESPEQPVEQSALTGEAAQSGPVGLYLLLFMMVVLLGRKQALG